MEAILNNFNSIKESIKDYPNTKLICGLSVYNNEDSEKIASSGITDVSDNRKETFLEKYNHLKKYNLVWHFFGILTTYSSMNEQFINSIDYLHSLESIDVAAVINKVRTKEEPIKCFIKVDVSDGKGPITPLKLTSFVKQLGRFPNIKVVGLMASCKFTYDEALKVIWYSKLKELQLKVQKLNLDYAPCDELSIGTEDDAELACRCGSTFININRII